MDERGNRTESGRFAPGVSGNPNGRPKLDPAVREMLECKTRDAAQRLIDALDATVVVHYQGVEVGTYVDHRMRVLAAETLLNRLYGKPTQEVTGEAGGPVKIGLVILPPETDG